MNRKFSLNQILFVAVALIAGCRSNPNTDFNPQGYWVLTAPKDLPVSSAYTNGISPPGTIPLTAFPDISTQLPQNIDIEYQTAPAYQTKIYFSDEVSYSIPIGPSGRGHLLNVTTRTQPVAGGYHCNQVESYSIRVSFYSSTQMEFAVLNQIEFVSTAVSFNCVDFLAGIVAALPEGTAPAPWQAIYNGGGLILDKLENLKWIHVDYLYQASRLSPTTTLMPSCDSAPVFSHFPTELDKVSGILPLGNSNPPSHTLPTDHVYFYFNHETAGDFSSPTLVSSVFAPGNSRVTSVSRLERISNVPVTADYAIAFSPCKEVSIQYGHVQTLTPEFLAQVGEFDLAQCQTFTKGGRTFRNCKKNLHLNVTSGDLIGTAGGGKHFAMDVGARDQRVHLNFISPAKIQTSSLHAVCPIDYFAPPLATALESLLGNHRGTYHRTQGPICGSTMEDVPNTAQGNWYHPGSSLGSDDPHLALKHFNINPDYLNFSIGTSFPATGPASYAFLPVTDLTSPQYLAGINRPFTTLTSDGQVYCFEGLGLSDGITLDQNGVTLLVDLPTPTTLRLAKKSGATCGAGPWTMPADAALFER